jgi:poly(3-hydroxyalkanoate) synthetase
MKNPDKNKKDLNFYEYIGSVEQSIKAIKGITSQIDIKAIKRAYNRLLTVSDCVSALI